MVTRPSASAVAAAVLLGGSAAPALADGVVTTGGAGDPIYVCVLTDYDPATGQRNGVCVWLPVEKPRLG